VERRVSELQHIFKDIDLEEIQQEYNESKNILLRLIQSGDIEIDIHNSFLSLSLKDPTKKAIIETSQSALLALSA
jgi:hypothetical protein